MRALKIGINALFRGKPTGVANYIINLVRCLGQIDKYNEYFIFVSRSNMGYFNFTQENMHEVICSVDIDMPLKRRLWEQTVLPSIVHKNELDIFHCPINILPVYLRCKCVVTLLDCQYFTESSKNTFLRKLFHNIFMRFSLKKAKVILTISNSMKKEIQHHLGGTYDNIYVTHLGQDYGDNNSSDVAPGKVKQNLGISRRYFLFIGFPHYRKNLTGLIKGFANTLKNLKEPYDLIICGDIKTTIESDLNNILKVIDELKIKDYVKLINYLDIPELKALIKGAEFFVFPSFYEGFGLPVIEAMACGTPVLVSDIPVMHEIAGDAAGYFDPYDIDDISRAIGDIITDDSGRERMSNLGREIVSRFTWENTAKKTLECYCQLIEKDI